MEATLLSEILAPIYRQALKKRLPYDILSYIEYYIKRLYSPGQSIEYSFSDDYIRRDVSAFSGTMEWPALDVHCDILRARMPSDLLSFLLNNKDIDFITMPLIDQGSVFCYSPSQDDRKNSPSCEQIQSDSSLESDNECVPQYQMTQVSSFRESIQIGINKNPFGSSPKNPPRTPTLESLAYCVACIFLTSPIRTAWHVFIMITQSGNIIQSCLLQLDQSGIIAIEHGVVFSYPLIMANPLFRRVLIITQTIPTHDHTTYNTDVATFFSYEDKTYQFGVLQWGEARDFEVYNSIGFAPSQWTRYTIPLMKQRSIELTDEVVANEIIMSAFLSHTIRNSYNGIKGSRELNVHCIGARVVERFRSKLAATEQSLHIIRGMGPWMSPSDTFIEFATCYDNSDIIDETKDLSVTKADIHYYGWDLFLHPTSNHERRDPFRLALCRKEDTGIISIKRVRRVKRRGDPIARKNAKKRISRREKKAATWRVTRVPRTTDPAISNQ